ncbi:MAG: hypothetical protein ACR2MO_02345 [Acidimicrobiales bacterium]
MTVATVAGHRYEFDSSTVEAVLEGVDPEPINEHYVVVRGRRFPPKQVLAVMTGLDRADFTTHQARAILRRLGFGVHRRSQTAGTGAGGPGMTAGDDGGPLEAHIGRWVAQAGSEILYAADDPESVTHWLRRSRRRARVWRVPADPGETGSALSSP